MPFWGWSKTPASNANSDPTINWAEGMAPSAVNDSARAMAARLAEWRDDISGTVTTGGTATGYTLASNQVFDSLAHMNGAMVAFVPHTTCGAIVTLNVDGLGAKPLRTSPGVEVPAGMLIQGTPYAATYNNSDGVFYLRDFYQLPYTVPIGGLLPYVGTTAPNSNFVLPFGQAISRTTYSALFALCASQFGGGDGSTTFNVPDLRGRAVFGITNMGGSNSPLITVAGGNTDGTNRTVGGAENHTLTTEEIPSHSHTATVTDPGHSHAINEANTISGSINGFVAAGSGANLGSNVGAIATGTTGITVANSNTGSGGAHSIMPPYMTLPYILRVI